VGAPVLGGHAGPPLLGRENESNCPTTSLSPPYSARGRLSYDKALLATAERIGNLSAAY